MVFDYIREGDEAIHIDDNSDVKRQSYLENLVYIFTLFFEYGLREVHVQEGINLRKSKSWPIDK